jgi:hypothetical protein
MERSAVLPLPIRERQHRVRELAAQAELIVRRRSLRQRPRGVNLGQGELLVNDNKVIVI